MEEIELTNLRGPREKHFLQKNGLIEARVYCDDIHYLKDGKYIDIDNRLIEDGNCYRNKDNKYRAFFSKNNNYDDDLIKIIYGENCLALDVLNRNITLPKVDKYGILYPNILNDIDLDYNLLPNKVKEKIILKSIDAINNDIVFTINTNLRLSLTENKIEMFDGNKIVFILDPPYMYDKNENYNTNIFYVVEKQEEGYTLRLILDKEWLEKATYPVIIDPTIVSSTKEITDTYIHSNDDSISNGSKEILKIGVEKNGTINRSLIRFDLPKIGTGNQVVNAKLSLTGYPLLDAYTGGLLSVHQVTSSWTESNAKWKNMNDKYNSHIEGFLPGSSSIPYPDNEFYSIVDTVDVTDLVKKWYTNVPNYGFMIKAYNEIYDSISVASYISKDNTAKDTNIGPMLMISYRNQTGVEDYFDLITQSFVFGDTYLNTYNGNLVGIFQLGSTFNSKMPASLNLIYNTHSFVLSDDKCGLGVGYKFDLFQTLTPQKIGDIDYLIYEDQDGTLHYFYKVDDYYEDEDGLFFKITKTDTEYILKDGQTNSMCFKIINDIGYLSKIIDIDGDEINITYDDSNRISCVTDCNNNTIKIVYNSDYVEITTTEQVMMLVYGLDGRIKYIDNSKEQMTINYNSDSKLIDSIVNINGLGYHYEYYNETPYRVKTIVEVGNNDAIGNSINITYDFMSTTIIDNKNRSKTITYNDYGNPVSMSCLSAVGNINDAYSMVQSYGESLDGNNAYVNKIVSEEVPVKYVNNYLMNTSFENEGIDFITTGDTILKISTDEHNFGLNSLEAKSTATNQKIYQTLNVPKGKYYTFSAYLKNDSCVRIGLSYLNSEGNSMEIISKKILPNQDFVRYDETIYYPEDAASELSINLYIDDIGTLYIDDVQLEEGEVANDYNFIDNSDFSKGTLGWNMTAYNTKNDTDEDPKNYCEVVGLEKGINALHVKMNPIVSTDITRIFPVSGTKGDEFYLSFWYKNNGIKAMPIEIMNNVTLNLFAKEEDENGQCVLLPTPLNINEKEWQHYSVSFVAYYDYDGVELTFMQSGNANDLYITNVCLFRDIKSIMIDYDDNGNPIVISNANDKVTLFNYDKHQQLVSMITPMGKNFKYEYDNLHKSRVLNHISASAINNQLKYDDNGNNTCIKISKKSTNDIKSGYYRIRLKGTSSYIKNINGNLCVSQDEDCFDWWYIDNKDDYYAINHKIINDKYFSYSNIKISLSYYHQENSLFNFFKQKNGSYRIQCKTFEDENDGYVCVKNNEVTIGNILDEDSNFDFYFEPFGFSTFIENNTSFTPDGNFIESITDSLLNEKKYTYDVNSGLLQSIVDYNGTVSDFIYDNLDRLTCATFGDRKTEYEYDFHDQISKIKSGSKTYYINRDDFLNITEILVGNISLFKNEYDYNNGNIIKSTSTNGGVLQFEYDDFDRLIKFVKGDKQYRFVYSSKGNLAKIISDDNVIRYDYDSSTKLIKYSTNDFDTIYKYDDENNVVEQISHFNDKQYTVSYELNDEDEPNKIIFNGVTLELKYDELGRITGYKLNDKDFVNYEYKAYGNRSSLLLSKVTYDDNKYSYYYDNANNIFKIYHNGQIQKEYVYDSYNQLSEETDYDHNRRFTYNYDNDGNMYSLRTYQLVSDGLLYEDKFEYNPEWKDQLIRFNGEDILYDGSGNPIQIGTTTLTWDNTCELVEIQSKNANIKYEYNHNGCRTKKIVNGVTTNYYYENQTLIFETINDNVIYYIRDQENRLIGLSYNDTPYYYIKNDYGSIVGIVDANGTIVAKYSYTSWGGINSVTDGEGNYISELEDHIANINPYRYRGYYYDTETYYYYIDGRYYSVSLHRFISPDKVINPNENIIGHNLYLYCENNPVSRTDVNGLFWFHVACGFIGGAIGFVSQLTSNVINGDDPLDNVWGAAAGGAVSGVMASFNLGPVSSGFVSSGVESLVNEGGRYVNGSKKLSASNLKESAGTIVNETLINGTINSITGDIADQGVKINKGWFKPTKFKSSFTGKYTRKVTANQVLGTVASQSTTTTGKNIKNALNSTSKKSKKQNTPYAFSVDSANTKQVYSCPPRTVNPFPSLMDFWSA